MKNDVSLLRTLLTIYTKCEIRNMIEKENRSANLHSRILKGEIVDNSSIDIKESMLRFFNSNEEVLRANFEEMYGDPIITVKGCVLDRNKL